MVAMVLFITVAAVLLMIWLLPIPRAWALALSGKYAATEIYERELARRPNRLPLYLTLAKLIVWFGMCGWRRITCSR